MIESCFVYSGAKLIVTVELVSFSHACDTTILCDLRVAGGKLQKQESCCLQTCEFFLQACEAVEVM